MTFFLDNCFPFKLGQILSLLEQDVVILKDRYAPDTPDLEWMPPVAEQDYIVITDDHRIRSNPAERQLLKELKLRVVFLPGGFARLGIWPQVAWIGTCWPKIAKECATLKPGVCLVVAMRGKVEVLEGL